MSSYDDETIRESGLTEREEETLPVWVRERLAALRTLESDLKAAVEFVRPSEEPTGVAYGDLRNGNAVYLPDSRFDHVHIQVGGERGSAENGEWLSISRKTDATGRAYLDVFASAGELMLRPQSLSSVRVYGAVEEGKTDGPDTATP